MIKKLFGIPKWKFIAGASFALIGQHIYDCLYNTEIEVFYQNTANNKDILSKCPNITGHFNPSIWSMNNIFGLFYVTLVEHQMVPLQKREIVTLKDGGQVALDWKINDPKNIVLVLHGLTGGGDCNYIKDTLERLYDAGYTAVCFNNRGVGFTKLSTPQYHNHGDPSDLMEIIDLIKQRYPEATLQCVAISIGANLAAKYAGIMKEKCAFKSIVCIANPFDLLACFENLDRWYNYLYIYYLTKHFKWLLNKHLDVMNACFDEHNIDIKKVFDAKTIYEFDHYFTRHLQKYESVEQMYRANSSIQYIKDITVPTLFVNTKNDPLIPWKFAPIQLHRHMPNLIFALTQKGGHIEWFSETNLVTVKRWIMDPTLDYLNYFRDLPNDKWQQYIKQSKI
ncbi:unnamed protein product [Paramecium pentaurelia]|uniref:AB hydrolase-1 domain-containing protein n=1 Tax=Paramecium pentaurelia TaxID=43138 RepID=A0A8S1W8I7_9CILI|nr:unnamed protein product [Paramecium pentaurelia]